MKSMHQQINIGKARRCLYSPEDTADNSYVLLPRLGLKTSVTPEPHWKLLWTASSSRMFAISDRPQYLVPGNQHRSFVSSSGL